MLYSFRADEVVQVSNTVQDGDDDPIEILEFQPAESIEGDFAIWLVRADDKAEIRTLELFIYGKAYNGWVYTNNLTGVDSVFGHAAAPEAVTVGALDAHQLIHQDVEPYSSQGPATIRYPVEEMRPKPDVCALDAVSVTGAGGFPIEFRGTSAAAPHIAAIAALLKGAMPEFSMETIREIITTDAADIWLVGYDTTSGYGRAEVLDSFDTRYAGVYTFATMEDFEAGMGDWKNIAGQDNCDWDLYGPVSDSRLPNRSPCWHMRFRTQYEYAEHQGDTAVLESADCFGTNQALSFLYHMCGPDVGTLNVDILSDGTLHEGIWSLSGPQQARESDAYRRAVLDLSQYSSPLRVRFRAVAAGGREGDIAIDNIQIVGSDTHPPAAPSGITIALDDGDVKLDWQDNYERDLLGYTVYRSTASGGPREAIARGLNVSEYWDGTVPNDTTYYYVVTAVDLASNESDVSDEVHNVAVTSDPLGDDFETGDFSRLQWVHSGHSDWTVTSDDSHEGNYCAQAGPIDNRQASGLSVTTICPDGEIAFYCRTSCEDDFDTLAFYIDGAQQGQWSGSTDWTPASFPVTAGTRTFEWVYSKDSSVSADRDTAWIDSVVFLAD